MLERAAERGARAALCTAWAWMVRIPLTTSENREPAGCLRKAKRTAGITLVKMIVTGLVLALVAGTVLKIVVRGAAIETLFRRVARRCIPSGTGNPEVDGPQW